MIKITLKEVVDFLLECGNVSITKLQRKYEIDYRYVVSILDKLEKESAIVRFYGKPGILIPEKLLLLREMQGDYVFPPMKEWTPEEFQAEAERITIPLKKENIEFLWSGPRQNKKKFEKGILAHSLHWDGQGIGAGFIYGDSWKDALTAFVPDFLFRKYAEEINHSDSICSIFGDLTYEERKAFLLEHCDGDIGESMKALVDYVEKTYLPTAKQVTNKQEANHLLQELNPLLKDLPGMWDAGVFLTDREFAFTLVNTEFTESKTAEI